MHERKSTFWKINFKSLKEFMAFDPITIFAILAAFALGGTLKGATGAGAPIMTIPVIAAFYDVRIAVIIMVLPNL